MKQLLLIILLLGATYIAHGQSLALITIPHFAKPALLTGWVYFDINQVDRRIMQIASSAVQTKNNYFDSIFPWYLTWWAFLVYLLISVSLLYLFLLNEFNKTKLIYEDKLAQKSAGFLSLLNDFRKPLTGNVLVANTSDKEGLSRNDTNSRQLKYEYLNEKSMYFQDFLDADFKMLPDEKSTACVKIKSLNEDQHLQTYFYNEITLRSNELMVSADYKLFLNNCISIVENNLEHPDFCIKILADKMGMSHSCLYKKIRAISGKSANSFIRLIRLRKAAAFFLHSGLTVSETAYKVGINDPKYFREQFSKLFGLNPSDYIKKHRILSRANPFG